jgi:hypothetical protein
MNWRTATPAEVAANPLAYHRSSYLEQRRAYPELTRLDMTEYGFMRKCAARRTLTKLVAAERHIASPERYIDRLRRTDPIAAQVLGPVFDSMFGRAA